ncbi:MAG: SUMF1/EgtB/PvdO family nonheme iron enzyme [Chloracidobacterium sp.]|nr:SUMF1/EgtB/PvdO family nonheme iron enzyme [Chloracidobacterium sp.]
MKECQLCKNCFPDDVATCPHDGMPTSHTIAGEPVLEGKYHLECRIGQGGMGVVYKARHAFLKTQLAIKVILPDLVGNDPQLVTRFRQEALAAAAIRHQNVVGVTDYGVIDGSLPFLVMEYVEGESLHDLLAREKALSPERALELITAVCAGVGAAHHQGIVHRDLKPLNVMICSDKPNLSQAVKILDFGLAKIKSGELLGSFIQAQTTGLMGSPYYMAPEQWADEEPDARSDVYSLGVMFFQMVAGDVPFKGSSIPAIMKKHISDPAPTFADYGTRVSLELEKAVLHTLQKDKTQRTATVEQFVEELTAAIHPGAATIHSSVGRSLPVSSLKVITKPPQSRVFVDNISVGETQNDGALTLEGIQSGNHHLRISHNGFKDWFGDVVCDGKPQQVVAELQPGVTDSRSSIPMPADVTVSGSGRLDDSHFQATVVNDGMGQTASHVYGTQSLPPKKAGKSAAILGILGVLALFLIVGGGIGAAYMMGVFGSKVGPGGNNAGTPTPSGTPVVAAKADLVAIPGGTFMMGSDSGLDNQKPAHSVTVQPFKMDKTEVTNAEYYAFTTATSYPRHQAFIDWRSKRDGVTYRLPTEEEWEFAARNGGKNNKYPWGDEFKKNCAVVDKDNTEPDRVGSNSCAKDWGVVDLIGNVYEWTGSNASLYPGSKGEMKPTKELIYMIRGGAALNKSAGEFGITSMFRVDVDGAKRDKELGFRLVTQN